MGENVIVLLQMAEANQPPGPPPATVGEVAGQIQATCRDLSSLLEGHCRDVCEKDDRIRGDAAKVRPLPVLQARASVPVGRRAPSKAPSQAPIVGLPRVARRAVRVLRWLRALTACRALQIDELEQKLHKFQYSLDWLESKVKEVCAPLTPPRLPARFLSDRATAARRSSAQP